MIPPMLALFSWPLAVIYLMRRLSPAAAVAIAIVGGYLLLPTEPVINPPLLPTIDKDMVPAFAALVLALVFYGGAGRKPGGPADILPGWLPRSPVSHILLFLLFAGSFLTVLMNGDRVVYGEKVLPGIQLYSGFSAALTAIVMLLPFVLGRKFLASDESQRTLLTVLCVAGLLYTIPMLYEIRMSPQLNRVVYGFFPSAWVQHMRGGGYRPLVFLQHGIWLAIFMAGSFLAALGLMRLSSGKSRTRWMMAAGWIILVMLMSRSLGGLVIALWGGAMLLFVPARAHLLVAAVVAGTVLTYPVLRGAGLVPVQRFVALAEKLDVNRANSLRYRLDNEDILLHKANQRPIAGWGGWGRNRVFDEKGEDISTTDGIWVIIIGRNGWIGYFSQFGLLGLPIILLALRRKRFEAGMATSCLALILASNMIDMIPNATRTPVTWLIAGALMGRLELQGAPARAATGRARRATGREGAGGPAVAADTETSAAEAQEGRVSPQYSARYTRQKYLHERSGS